MTVCRAAAHVVLFCYGAAPRCNDRVDYVAMLTSAIMCAVGSALRPLFGGGLAVIAAAGLHVHASSQHCKTSYVQRFSQPC